MSGCEVTAHSPADMGVSVGTGEALLSAGRFVYETSTDLVIPTADPDNPRIDIICIADDGTIEGPTENAALQGTPAAEPTAPTIPVGYIGLAQVAVGTGAMEIAGGDITDTRWVMPTFLNHVWDDTAHFTGTEKADRLLTAEDMAALTSGEPTDLHSHEGLGKTGHPYAVSNLLETITWAEEIGEAVRLILDSRPQMWRELLALMTMVDDMRTIMAGSSRRSFTDEDRACAGSTTTDFTLDVLNEGLLVQVDLTISGTSPDIDFSIYRDASRTVLVKTWAGVTATTTFRELLDWLNEETPQDGLAYCSVLNNTANEATVTTTLTIKEA